LIGIPYSYVAPRDVVETNVVGTLNVLEAARDHGSVRVLHTSTSEVYGTARYVPIDESHPLLGQSPYSASKIGADHLAESFYRSFGLPVVTVRPFNTYGPRQSARAVVPTIIQQALIGNVIRLGSLNPKRDLNFVSDTVAGFLSIAGAANTCTEGQTFNLGTGEEVSVGQLVAMIGRLLGRELRVEEDPQRVRPKDSEVMRLVADNSKCRRVCGWRPRMSLEAGLQVTIDWMQRNGKRDRPGIYGV
jgi:dTDP-glucose 4,6-dehydratase